MEDLKPEIEQLLDRLSTEGEDMGCGEFSLSANLAHLEKFLLPFRGAWILKIVQAAVVSSCQNGIQVRLGRKQAEIQFDSGVGWSLEEVIDALTSLHSPSDPALRYVIEALRASLAEGRRFSLALPHWNQSLIWSGKGLLRQAGGKRRKFHLSVMHSCDEARWRERERTRRLERLELARILSERAACCPVTISVDGVDLHGVCCTYASGHLTLSHGYWNSGDLPHFLTPRRKLVRSGEDAPRELTGQVDRADSDKLTSQSGIYVFKARFKLTWRLGRKKWSVDRAPSFINWLSHGVILERMKIFEESRVCQLEVYLSAQDLPLDLSGLQLRDSAEMRVRKARALEELGSRLRPEVSLRAFGSSGGGATINGLVAGSGIGFVGGVALAIKFFPLATALPAIATFMSLFGGGLGVAGGTGTGYCLEPSNYDELARALQADLVNFGRDFRRLTPPGD